MGKSKLLVGLIFTFILSHQVKAQDRYAVFYKFKPQETFSLDRPAEFLSLKALERRNREGISVDSLDMPVSKKYVDEVHQSSRYILYSSKWFNASMVVADKSEIQAIANLPYIERVELIAKGYTPNPNARIGKRVFASFTLQTCSPENSSKRILAEAEESYDFQNNLLGIDEMHEEGYTGKGVIISVFDAGFPGVDHVSVFSHLQSNHQIIATKNMVKPWENNVYQDNQHGTNVLSLIAANEPGVMVAGAYNATYFLAKTEEIPTEYKIEEFNWARAAEFADSLGTDIISSSLGYIDFDDPDMTYSADEMDGETTYMSTAASIAAQRGILVVNSAGNYGPNETSISSPSDAKGILAIGSVDNQLIAANSSSRGPTADGRIKPDLAAMGHGAALIRADGTQGYSNGTSFAAPQISALAAGLWEARPEWTKDELIQNLLNSASQADNPDNILGYGIPNFRKALYGKILSVEDYLEDVPWKVYPNPLDGDVLNIHFGNSLISDFALLDLNGRIVQSTEVIRASLKDPFRIEIEGVKPGIYIIQMQDGALVKHSKLFRY